MNREIDDSLEKINYLNNEVDRLDSMYNLEENKFFPDLLIGYIGVLAIAPPLFLHLNYGVNPFTYSYNDINVNLLITCLAGSIAIPLGVMDTIKDYQKYKLVKENNKKVVSQGKQLLKSLKNEKRYLEELKNNSI
ncbi:MAG: hypothetical protein IKH54_02620 [Bacilli bacterium]|nr:hypothetical protein [Bacilli bacterium]